MWGQLALKIPGNVTIVFYEQTQVGTSTSMDIVQRFKVHIASWRTICQLKDCNCQAGTLVAHTRDSVNDLSGWQCLVMQYVVDPVNPMIICSLLDLLYHKIGCMVWGDVIQDSMKMLREDKSGSMMNSKEWGIVHRKRELITVICINNKKNKIYSTSPPEGSTWI